MGILAYFYDIYKELDKKILFYNQSSSICQRKKLSSVEFGIWFDTGAVKLIKNGIDLDDAEQCFLFGNYNEVSIWVEIKCSGLEACLRFQYYKNGAQESLYYGPYIANNKCSHPSKCNNLQHYGTLFNWFCTNKPALIRYSDYHYDQNNKNLLPQTNMVRLVVGNQTELFHTHCWLFAEYMDWMISSVLGMSGQFSPDDVANWMYDGWSLI